MNYQLIYDAPEVKEMQPKFEAVGLMDFQCHVDDAILAALELYGETGPQIIILEVIKILDGVLRNCIDKRTSKPATTRWGRILRSMWAIRQMFGRKKPA